MEATPNGFPRLAAFQSSEANFALYRSFSYLHSRVLLDLQDEITSLERELDDIDEDDECEDPDRLRSREIDEERSRNEGGQRTRRIILREIKGKLMEYGERYFIIIIVVAAHIDSLLLQECGRSQANKRKRRSPNQSSATRVFSEALRSQLSQRSKIPSQHQATHGCRNGCHPKQRRHYITP